jgi:hypothetical protein
MSPDGKTRIASLATGALAIRIAGEPVRIVPVDHNAFMDIATAPIAWGAARSGLQIGLIYLTRKSHYLVGERVRAAVVLRNVSTAPISFWHQTSFAFMESPTLVDAGGKSHSIPLATETEWSALHEASMTGVTYDMTFAPSADGPSRLRRSVIQPGQTVIGYGLTAFVAPRTFAEGTRSTGRHTLVQTLKLGLRETEGLDTTLETGGLALEIVDAD